MIQKIFFQVTTVILIFNIIFINVLQSQTTLIDNNKYSLKKVEYLVDGTPFDLKHSIYRYDGWYGFNPKISVNSNDDNSYDIVWSDTKTFDINLLLSDKNDNKIKELKLLSLGRFVRLLGFTKIPEKGYYIIAYSYENSNHNEYKIAAFDIKGNEIFNKHIFGKNPDKPGDPREYAGQSSTGRLVYNPITQNIGFYTGHKKLWNDGIKHQGSYVGFLTAEGEIIKNERGEDLGKKWYVSHDFGQRMITDGKYYYLLSHGDAYPRALQISKWQDTSYKARYSYVREKIWEKEYFPIPGEIGHNRTDTELGDLIKVNDSLLATVYCTSHGSTKRNLKYTVIKEKKTGSYSIKIDYKTYDLTNYTDYNAFVPKIAKLKNNNILVLWQKHDAGKKFINTNMIETDFNGNIISEYKLDKGIELQPVCDIVSLPNGEIIWALGDETNKKIIVYKLKFKK